MIATDLASFCRKAGLSPVSSRGSRQISRQSVARCGSEFLGFVNRKLVFTKHGEKEEGFGKAAFPIMKTIHSNLIHPAQNGEFDLIVHDGNCFCTMGAGIAKGIKDGTVTTTIQQIDLWRSARSEHQHLEFKEAKTQYDNKKFYKYCVNRTDRIRATYQHWCLRYVF